MGPLNWFQKLGYAAANSRMKRISLTLHTLFCDLSLRMVFREEMAAWRPDVVHAHDGIALPLASKVSQDCGAKLVFDSHELETHRNPPLSRIRKLQVRHLERKYLPRADEIFTVGVKIAKYLEANYRISRPVVLYNSPRAKPNPMSERWDTPDRTNLREELRIRRNGFLLVHTGNVTFNRGIEQAVIGLSKAVSDPAFKTAFPGGVHLALVGNSVPQVVARIEQLHKRYGECIALHFVKPVAANRIVEYISTADASISAGVPLVLSYEFGMPNKLFEAVMAGLPMIASDLVEMKRFIAENQLGISYQADDTDKLAEAFTELALNFERYRTAPDRLDQLRRKFSWEAQEIKLLQSYNQLLETEVKCGRADFQKAGRICSPEI